MHESREGALNSAEKILLDLMSQEVSNEDVIAG